MILDDQSTWYCHKEGGFDAVQVSVLGKVASTAQGFSSGVAKSIPYLRVKKYYPKTTVPMATEFHPKRFDSINSTFKWASLFLDHISICFGQEFVKKRLAKWRWSLSTAFSGVGCAENVGTSDHAYAFPSHQYNDNIFDQL